MGVGSNIGSLSSRDIRFSAAVKLPCDNGEGRAGRGIGVEIDVEGTDAVFEAMVVEDSGGESGEDRVVAVDPDDDVEEFR